jgi:hypothetical protein
LIVIGLELVIRRSMKGPTGDIAAVLVVLIAVVGAAAYVAVAPNPSSTQTFEASSDVGNITEARAEIDVGAATITISGGGDIGSKLYHARIGYSGTKPEVRLDSSGKLTISQPGGSFAFGSNRRIRIDLALNPAVGWTLTVNSGATSSTIDAAHLHLAGLSFNTGAANTEITLGPPSGMVPVTFDGGALTVHIHRPVGTAVRAEVSGGALSLNGDGHDMHAIGQLNYESSGFSSAADGYRVKLDGGSCSLTLDTTVASG